MRSVNPATGENIQTFEELTDQDLETKLAKAARTAKAARAVPFAQRSAWMLTAAEILEARKEEFGRIMTLEMGKPFSAAVAEVEKCALACRHYSEYAEAYLRAEDVKTDALKSYVVYQPLGVVLAIMPWNFPFWQVVRFAAPALMAGNVGLLKHASNVPQSAMALEEIFSLAGFPDGSFQTLLIGSKRVEALIDDPRVAAVTLTGSEAAGSAVGGQAGRQIKKAVLELGGSDPFIIMPSADLDAAIETAVKARVINNGQSCIAAKRFIVHESIADQVERGMADKLASLVVGDPMDAKTQVGPLATESILDELVKQVDESVAAGARLVTGGKRLDRPGYYFQPTLLADIPTSAPAYGEETFGPVASLFRVRSVEEAIEVANGTSFGLGSAAWTNDPAEQLQFIDGIEAGSVFINGMVASDPRLPFGGVKRSGYGRELGVWGIREFVNIKTIYIGQPKVSKQDVNE